MHPFVFQQIFIGYHLYTRFLQDARDRIGKKSQKYFSYLGVYGIDARHSANNHDIDYVICQSLKS